MKPLVFLTGLAVAVSSGSACAQSVFNGNGASGFGSPVGSGNITISDTATSLTITFNRGSGLFNDDLVLYLDTQSGGFTDTSSFSDNGDGGRTAISGYNSGNPSRTQVNLPFAADYAFSIQNGFIGVFTLASGGNGTLGYLFGAGQSGNNNDASYSITLNAAQMAQIGITANSGQTFSFVGTYISTTAYRANETIGASTTVPVDGSGNAGYGNSQTFSSALTYTVVPEPSTIALGASGLATLLLLRRRR